MDDIWNENNIQQPPLIVLPVTNAKLDISSLTKILSEAKRFYGNQKDFDEAAALCSRLIARRKNSFKKMLGFKNMCKLNSSLCRLLRVNIKEILNNFQSILPEYISKVTKTYLPTRSCLEYVLIRLISIHKIYKRTEICARLASNYFIQLLNQNFFQEIITVFLSVLSQIWKLSQKNLTKTAFYYRELLKFRFDLPESKKPWLKNEIEFPDKLDNHELLDNEDNSSDNINKLRLSSATPLMQQTSSNQIVVKESNKIFDQQIDTGTIISRDSFLATSGKSIKTKIHKINIQNINTLEEIRNFFAEEGQQRQRSLKLAITKDISNGEWISIKKTINNSSNNEKKAVKLFKFFVQNKILK